MGLTARQLELLNFIRACLVANDGVAPSFNEMQAHMGTSSRGNVHDMVKILEARGHITRLKRRARAIQVNA